MEADKELIKGIEKMRTGDKNGFLVFYNKTFQFTCIWASRIMRDPLRKNDFLAEFYPYALLHIADLKDNEKVYSWLEEILPIFYELWSGEPYYLANKAVHPRIPDETSIRSSAVTAWGQINERVSFPEKPKKRRIPLPILIIGFISLMVLSGCIMILASRGMKRADQETIDRINAENREFITGSELDKYLTENGGNGISGLYTETTTELTPEELSGTDLSKTDIKPEEEAR